MRPASTVFYGILVVLIGILLIVFHNHGELLSWVVILAGISLIIPCLYTLISTVSGERKQRRQGVDTFSLRLMTSGMVVTSVIGIGLGIWLVVSPGFFIGFLAYAFAVLLIIYGIYHLCILLWVCKPLKMPGYFYIIPVLLIIAGLVILFSTVREIQSAVILITGIGLIGAGFSSIIEYIAARSAAQAIKSESDGKHIAE